MAQHYYRNSPVPLGLSKAHVTTGSTPVSGDDVGTPDNYQSPADLDAALSAKGAPYNQTGYLDSMTLNDKRYALKLLDDATNYGQV